jgi:hypothetical protein
MPTFGLPPHFQGKPVLIDFHPSVRNSNIVPAAIHGLVRRMEDTHADEDELLIRIHDLVAEYDGLVARLVGRSAEAIEFSVAHQ